MSQHKKYCPLAKVVSYYMKLHDWTLNVSLLSLVILEGILFGAVVLAKYHRYQVSARFHFIKYLICNPKDRLVPVGLNTGPGTGPYRASPRTLSLSCCCLRFAHEGVPFWPKSQMSLFPTYASIFSWHCHPYQPNRNSSKNNFYSFFSLSDPVVAVWFEVEVSKEMVREKWVSLSCSFSLVLIMNIGQVM